MILVAQLEPPSRLTAANIPAAGTTTLVTITILFGLVGLTAIVSSDSLLESWLTSMFAGVVGGPASSGNTMRLAASPSKTEAAKAGFFDFIETLDGFWEWQPKLFGAGVNGRTGRSAHDQQTPAAAR